MGSHAWAQQVSEGLISPASPPLPVYPSQLFESALLLVIYAVLFRHYRHRRPGEQVAIYSVSYAIVRFVIEAFRSDVRAHVGPLTISQFISVLLFTFGAGLLLVLRARKRLPG
jgi:phosphatidylglycerol:prolipoprotein diacylglycerol transferase